MRWIDAPDVAEQLQIILQTLEMPHVAGERIIAFRSFGSKGRAIARIWSMPTVWQLALKIQPHYVIEVISERFDRMSLDDQYRTLIHELMHIPKTFSGALVPHRNRGHHINHHNVEILFREFAQRRKK